MGFYFKSRKFLGIRLPTGVDYGCATVREFHTIHPLFCKYKPFFISRSLQFIHISVTG